MYMVLNLCSPAILYIGFSLTQIIIDIFKHMYNTALLKFIIMIFFTFILNTLCSNGLSIVSWMVVFIPFILMTIITSMILYILGLSPMTGKLDYNIEYPKNNTHFNNIRENTHLNDVHLNNTQSNNRHLNNNLKTSLKYNIN